MKRKILLGILMVAAVGTVQGQKTQKTTAYAITSVQKGGSSWTEVRLVDIGSGEEMKSIYQSKQEAEVLNARTGKPIVKKDLAATQNGTSATPAKKAAPVITITDDRQVFQVDAQSMAPVRTIVRTQGVANNQQVRERVYYINHNADSRVRSDKPFATSSAAMAYDKKHERLYYTPMGIAQLRYIDLKTNKIFYFEDEPFGVLKGSHDVPNQITRMVIASDGDGYALTNNGNHLIRFTTDKKPVITDLGALTDAAGNSVSVHSSGIYGGDMIADNDKNLFLITANRHVFRISLENKVATYLGAIKNLPRGFSTNGAVVEGGSKVIVSSSSNTMGYFRFDLNTLEAEKVSTGASVFNASDLANGILAFAKEKKKKERKSPEVRPDIVQENPVEPQEDAAQQRAIPRQVLEQSSIAVYPNPVTDGRVKLAFGNQPSGRYQVQLLDLNGKVVSQQEVNIGIKSQIVEINLPAAIAKGSYLVKVENRKTKFSSTAKLIVGE
jgi:hypothetical protein